MFLYIMYFNFKNTGVAELVDAPELGFGAYKSMRVQISPPVYLIDIVILYIF